MRPQTPLEVCTQIVSDHAAAIAERRTARLAARLEDYATALIELADEYGQLRLPGEDEPGQHGDSRS
jgi:hypothetical protein